MTGPHAAIGSAEKAMMSTSPPSCRRPHEPWTARRLIDALWHRSLTGSVVVLLLAGALSTAVGTAVGLVSFRDVGYPDSATLLRVGEFIHSGKIYPDIDRP